MCLNPIKIKKVRNFLTEEENPLKVYFQKKREIWLKTKNKKEYSKNNEEYEYIEVPCGH